MSDLIRCPEGRIYCDVAHISVFRGGSAQAGARSVQSSAGTRQGQGQVSSALQKASALTGKIQQKAVTRKVVAMESDSDESFNLRMAKSVADLVSLL